MSRAAKHGTYAIDGDLILKTQRPNRLRPRTSLAREVFYLRQVEGRADISVPRVLGYGREGDVEYTLMTRMKGLPVSRATLSESERRGVLLELGRLLRGLHRLPQEPFFNSRLFPGDHTPVDFRWRLGNLFDETVEKLCKSGQTWSGPLEPQEIATRAMRALPDADEWVALHSNPAPEHAFVDPGARRLTGLIDFGDSYFSHPSARPAPLAVCRRQRRSCRRLPGRGPCKRHVSGGVAGRAGAD